MPVVATPSTPVILTVDQVRRFMRDYPDRNILLDGVEFDINDINQGIEFVTSRFNVVTPITTISYLSRPTGSSSRAATRYLSGGRFREFLLNRSGNM